MIAQQPSAFQPGRDPPPWQVELARAVASPLELLRLLEIDPDAAGLALSAPTRFRQRVPHAFIARMRRGDPADPLLRQVLPLAAEDMPAAGFNLDPVGDRSAEESPGVLHKYRGRALLITTGACAIHCRYCFRRHYPYGESTAAADGWATALRHLAAQPQIEEVILSGGDPLALTDDRLADLVRQMETIPHVRRLRLHTRLPVVLPARVDDRLLGWLANTRLQRVVVIHANHGNEIDATVARALADLRHVGATLLNQSVLLKVVNDDVGVLRELSEKLMATGVLPYYLHQLDRVAGAAHFEVDDDTALGLIDELRQCLPGYLVPSLVREIPGAPCKQPL